MGDTPDKSKRFRYTNELDADLMDHVCLVNPWAPGKTWDDVRKSVRQAQPAFDNISSKSLMDRANLLMKKRAEAEAAELKASGIVGDEISDLERTLDEALQLKYEADIRERERKDRKRTEAQRGEERGQLIKNAALGIHNDNTNEIGNDAQPEKLKRKLPQKPSDMTGILAKKLKFDQSREDGRLQLQREQLQFQQATNEAEHKLRREEIQLRREELALQAKRDEDASKERRILLDFLMKNSK